MNTYFALTIGPIYKMMAMARKTSELWASSYLFSYLMGDLVEALRNKGELVMPAFSTEKNLKAGLYPDRLILKMTIAEFTFTKAQKVVCDVRDRLIADIAGSDIDKQQEFLKNYFQLYSLKISLPENEDPVNTILPLLDSMEQKATYVSKFEDNYLKDHFENLSDSFLFKKAFSNAHYKFPSVFKVSAAGLKNEQVKKIPNDLKVDPQKVLFDQIMEMFWKDKDQDKKVKQLIKIAYDDYPQNDNEKEDWKRNPETEVFRFHHNYVAIIQADGDNLSQALHAFYTAGKIEAVQKFSRFLMEFGEEATLKIEDFGGTPIYMGGDDLLFFAPVKCNNKTIFNLVDDLDKLFENKLIKSKELNDFIGEWESGITEKNRRKKIKFSISYGISIGYHKYPLSESLETARKLLFNVSKMVPKKNALSFKVLKHGGQFFGATWRKDWRSYRLFLVMLKDAVIEDNFLTSVQHKLNPLRPVLYRILIGDEIDPAKASFRQDISKHLYEETGRELFLNRMNINFFNDLIHKEDGKRKFLDLCFEYLLQVYRDMEDIYGNNRQTAEKAVDSLYATLRFIQFIYQPDHNEEEK